MSALAADLFLEFGKHLPGKHGQKSHGGGGRAFAGAQIETKKKLSKLEVGELGEKIVIDYLKSTGAKDARGLNIKQNNFAVDVVQNHGAIEVKAGQVSNGRSAQQWRATIGQPGKAETRFLKTLDSDQKREWNQKKNQQILKRKEQAVQGLSEKLGRKVKSQTYGVIINPDTKQADLYKFDGFHLRIGWNTPQARAGYVGTVTYGN
jgi:hypothetical protein